VLSDDDLGVGVGLGWVGCRFWVVCWRRFGVVGVVCSRPWEALSPLQVAQLHSAKYFLGQRGPLIAPTSSLKTSHSRELHAGPHLVVDVLDPHLPSPNVPAPQPQRTHARERLLVVGWFWGKGDKFGLFYLFVHRCRLLNCERASQRDSGQGNHALPLNRHSIKVKSSPSPAPAGCPSPRPTSPAALGCRAARGRCAPTAG